MKYRIYIDEVGNPDLESSTNPNHRFLSLTGIIVELDHMEKIIHPQMEALKSKYFHSHPDDPVILHRKEMFNAKPPFDSLQNQAIRDRFDNVLQRLISKWEYIVITVCLDKKIHKETYQTWRYDPYHYCLALLLERFILFLERSDSYGDAMAESRGGREDRRLKDSFERLWNIGTDFVSADLFQKRLSSRQLKVKPKMNNISGLQLADLIAHPSRNEILEDQGFLTKPMSSFSLKIKEILQTKYDQSDGRIYGKKFL